MTYYKDICKAARDYVMFGDNIRFHKELIRIAVRHNIKDFEIVKEYANGELALIAVEDF